MLKSTALAWADNNGAELARRISKRFPKYPLQRSAISEWDEDVPPLREYHIRTLMQEQRDKKMKTKQRHQRRSRKR